MQAKASKSLVFWLENFQVCHSHCKLLSASLCHCFFPKATQHYIVPNQEQEKNHRIKKEKRKLKQITYNTSSEKEPEWPYYLFWNLITRSCCNPSHEVACNERSDNHRPLAGWLFLQRVPIKMQWGQDYWHLANFSGITFRKTAAQSASIWLKSTEVLQDSLRIFQMWFLH